MDPIVMTLILVYLIRDQEGAPRPSLLREPGERVGVVDHDQNRHERDRGESNADDPGDLH